MKRETCRSEVSEGSPRPVVFTQVSALLRGGDVGEEAELVVRLHLALLLVEKAVDLAAGC